MLVKEVLGMEARLKGQRDRIRRGEYRHLGMLEAVSLDMEKGQRIDLVQLQVVGRVIDLGRLRRPLAMSLDGQDLLLPTGLPRKLPDVPDPNFPGRMTIQDVTPFIPQTYAERASFETDMLGKHWIGFQPVLKLILVNDCGVLDRRSAFPRIHCSADGEGRHMVLLVCPEWRDNQSSEAYLIGGRFQFSVALGRPEPIPGPAAYAIR
jgi:hypothetical protein